MSRASSHSHAGHSHAHANDPAEHQHPGLSVTVEKGAGKAAVRMTVALAELERARGQEFVVLSRRVALKGFRPGKTPRALLERHFGDEVEKRVVEHFLQHGYQMAVDEHGLRPAAYPRVDVAERLPKKGEDWSIDFEIVLRPEIALGPIEGLEIEGHPTLVSDEEMERAVTEIKRANSRAEPAGEAALEAEGMVVATIEFLRPGTEESVLSRDGIRLAPSTAPAGVDPATFKESLIGVHAGDQRVFEMEFPPNFPVEEARGEKGRVRVNVKEVLRVVPPSNEEIYKAFEVADEAAFRVALRERMQNSKQEAEDQRIERELLERLIESHPMELPAQLVEDQVAAHEAELLEQLAKQGLGEDEARVRAEEERPRSRASAEKALRAVYLIEEIARQKELKVTQEDVSGEMHAIAERNGTQPAEVAKYYGEQGLLRQLGLELLERKVRRYLRASAAVRAPT